MGDVGAQAPETRSEAIDWEAIERSPEFRELVASRRRFAVVALGLGAGLTVVYVLVAYLAPDAMGASVGGSVTLGFVLGVALILLTWAITLIYLVKSDREWGPLERRAAHAADAPEPRTPEGVR